MIQSLLTKIAALALTAGVVGAIALAAQQPAAPAADLANPYRTIERWGNLPAGRSWGAVSGVDIDRDGRSVWVVERCGGTSCTNSTLAPILKLDAAGSVVTS